MVERLRHPGGRASGRRATHPAPPATHRRWPCPIVARCDTTRSRSSSTPFATRWPRRPCRDAAVGRGGRVSRRRARRVARDRRRPSSTRMLDDAGLRAVASHEGIERLRADAGRRGRPPGRARLPARDRAVDAGGGPARPPTTFAASPPSWASSPAAWRADGIALGYHNHDFEFAPLDGTTVWDVLAGRAPARGRTRAGRLLGCGRRPGSRRRRSGPSPTASGCST